MGVLKKSVNLPMLDEDYEEKCKSVNLLDGDSQEECNPANLPGIV